MNDIKAVTSATKKTTRFNIALASMVGIVIFGVLIVAGYGVYTFLHTYGFQNPVQFRSPIYELHPDVIISPISTGSATMQGTFNVGDIADKIYTLESSGGKNDGCKRLGKFNGYGFRQNDHEWVCYESHAQVRLEVINWLTKNIKDGNIEKAMCLYNKGTIEEGCAYALNYKSL